MPDLSKIALIIGIDTYHHSLDGEIPSLPPLPSCKKDAIDIYGLFKKYGYTIFRDGPLIGSNLSKGEGYKKIQQTMEDFFLDADAGQTLVFYFSGHGITNGGQVFLSTPEVNPQKPLFTAINLFDLTTLINNSRSTRIVGIIDACYSGAAGLSDPRQIDKAIAENAADTAVGVYDKIKGNIPVADGKCLLLSSQVYQKSKAEKDSNSVYTKYLKIGLEGVESGVDNNGIPIPSSVDEYGDVTPQTLHDYVYNRVANELKSQTPRIKSSISSKIILVRHDKFVGIKKLGSAIEPDLSIYIYNTRNENNESSYYRYDVLVSSSKSLEENFRYDLAFMGTISLQKNPKETFLDTFRHIESSIGQSPQAFSSYLESQGFSFYDLLFPEELKTMYWKIRNRIKSIWVISDEAWIPWEVIKPWRKLDDGTFEEDPFLCERYEFSRWRRGIPYTTNGKSINKIRLVVPSDTNLKSVLKEKDWIIDFAKYYGLKVDYVSSYGAVTASLKVKDYDIWHFATNGNDNNFYPTIALENGEQLSPMEIIGPRTTFGISKPLVFMNTCQSSTYQGFSLLGSQNWADRFLRAGACAFIGTLWTISDESAYQFARETYTQLSNGIPLGEAVRKARLSSKTNNDPSWLSYQLYGHPNIQFKFHK